MGKWVLQDLAPAQGAWLRYASAWVAYFLFWVGARTLSKNSGPAFVGWAAFKRSPRDLLGMVALGAMTFCFSPLLQLQGLSGSRAVDNAIIIALEPLMTVALAWFFLGEGLSKAQGFAFAIATAGFFFLAWGAHAGLEPAQTVGVTGSRLLPNLILVVSLLGECTFSVLGRPLVKKYPPLPLFGTALGFGVFFLTLALALSGKATGSGVFASLTLKSAFALLWLGPLGTMAAYVFWLWVLIEAPVAGLVLTLFVQPVFGTFWSALFLGEWLSPLEALGGVMILGAVAAASTTEIRRSRRAVRRGTGVKN